MLEDVNGKEKVVKSRLRESEIFGRHPLLSMIRSRMCLKQIIRGKEAKTLMGQVMEWTVRS